MLIGFLGLGRMGAAIARNLVHARNDVAVWNRSTKKARPLIDSGATMAATPREAAAGRDVVFSMLADDAALDDVLCGKDGLLEGLQPGSLHVSLSTISVAMAEKVTANHAERRQHFLASPVFGRPDAAAAAKLSVVAAGAPDDFEMAKPLFAAFSQREFYIATQPSTANLVKLCGNFMILAAIEAMAEAMTLAEKGGVPRAK